MARWLSSCLRTHTVCRQLNFLEQEQSHPVRWTPTRLLEVEQSESGQVVRLIHPQGDMVGPLEAYVTLSHCWGNKQPSKLLVENFKSYEDGYRVSRLPKTYREAIQVCSWLDGETSFTSRPCED